MFRNSDGKKEKNMADEEDLSLEDVNKQQEEDTAKENPEAGIGKTLDSSAQADDKFVSLENQYLRLLADYQNLQKRSAQQIEELYKYAAQKTIEVILPALDTFDYARSTLKPDSKPEKIIEDFNLVFEMLLKCLKDIGLETIEETGIPFNPVYHEPLHQIPTDELPDHTVMQVLKKGYMLNKKVIRPALVSVSIKQRDPENASDEHGNDS